MALTLPQLISNAVKAANHGMNPAKVLATATAIIAALDIVQDGWKCDNAEAFYTVATGGAGVPVPPTAPAAWGSLRPTFRLRGVE